MIDSCQLCCRLEQEAVLSKLKKDLESLQQVEKAGLEEQKQLAVERMKLEAEAVEQAELQELEQERQRALQERKERLHQEQETVRRVSCSAQRSCLKLLRGDGKICELQPWPLAEPSRAEQWVDTVAGVCVHVSSLPFLQMPLHSPQETDFPSQQEGRECRIVSPYGGN